MRSRRFCRPDVNLGELVQAALANETAWEPQLPAGGEALVTIAGGANASGSFVHPLAGLNVMQNVALQHEDDPSASAARACLARTDSRSPHCASVR